MTKRSGAALLAAPLLLAACAGRAADAPATGPGGDVPVSADPSPATTPGVPGEPTPLIVTPRAGLVDVRPRPWEAADVAGERALVLEFYGGVEECYGVARVDVEYAADAVTVTLFEGRVPAAEVCIELAVRKAVRVRLEQPLAGRRVVDGAARG